MIEKFYRRMIDGVPAAVIAADENLRVIFANKRFKSCSFHSVDAAVWANFSGAAKARPAALRSAREAVS